MDTQLLLKSWAQNVHIISSTHILLAKASFHGAEKSNTTAEVGEGRVDRCRKLESSSQAYVARYYGSFFRLFHYKVGANLGEM